MTSDSGFREPAASALARAEGSEPAGTLAMPATRAPLRKTTRRPRYWSWAEKALSPSPVAGSAPAKRASSFAIVAAAASGVASGTTKARPAAYWAMKPLFSTRSPRTLSGTRRIDPGSRPSAGNQATASGTRASPGTRASSAVTNARNASR